MARAVRSERRLLGQHATDDDPIVGRQDRAGDHHDQAPEQHIPAVELLAEEGLERCVERDHPHHEDAHAKHGALGAVIGNHPDDQENVGGVDAGARPDAAEDEEDEEVADRIQQGEGTADPKDGAVVGPGDRDHPPGVVAGDPDEDQRQPDRRNRLHGEREDGGEQQARPANHRSESGQPADRGRVQTRSLGAFQSKQRQRPHSPDLRPAPVRVAPFYPRVGSP